MRASFPDRTLELADPMEPFQANLWQMMVSRHAPSRRLISAGCGPSHCLVHYEEGGYHHSFRVLVFGLNRHDAQIEWAGTPFRSLANVAALKAFVRE
ncbi:MAG: hypothetical protein DMG04_13495 [Acidobacteria bacterium]|nr:MAG: hypothetical protein DMG04_13495 [Acidobacteriota bacterium]PYQ83075.1 MAG: hypothetical protein DMG03_15315 [Acidobacteriota bacterium]PYR06672.1 MAG: hypothetical protein DMF99_25355 [Acidobacteriota bacterium]